MPLVIMHNQTVNLLCNIPSCNLDIICYTQTIERQNNNNERRKEEIMRAKYIGKVRDRNGYAVHLFYEYRGHEYMITDEHNGYSETLKEKHEAEQKRIDDIIENKKKENKTGEEFSLSVLDMLY